MKDCDAILMIGNSKENADLYWATGFKTSGDFIFIQTKKDKIIIVSRLEIERAKRESKVTKVLLERIYWGKIKEEIGEAKYKNLPIYLKDTGVIDLIFKKLGTHKILVSKNFSLATGKALEKKGYELVFKDREPLFKQRGIKTKEEIGYITEVQKAAEKALRKALGIIQKSEIKNGFLYRKGKILNSEDIKKIIGLELFKKGCLAKSIVVSCGKDSAMPHNLGTGPLKAGEPIVIDIFPQSMESSYFADMTRTVVKGKAPERLKKMYCTVLEGQKIALSMIREGARGDKIHKTVKKYFVSQGFKTSIFEDPPYGFLHSIGHGVGLELQEYPGVGSSREGGLKAGNVLAIEPGLYYPGFGGVRIEDLVVVTKNGYRNLTEFEKERFEL